MYQESSGLWTIALSRYGYATYATTYGGLGYKVVAGDFNGLGQDDLAVYKEANGNWLFLYAETTTLASQSFGQEGYEPVTGDYDGDGQVDLVLRHSASGIWYLMLSRYGHLTYALLFL